MAWLHLAEGILCRGVGSSGGRGGRMFEGSSAMSGGARAKQAREGARSEATSKRLLVLALESPPPSLPSLLI